MESSRNRFRGAWKVTCLCMAYSVFVSGCASKYDRVMTTPNDRVEISRTHSEFSKMANTSNLPMSYVSEGKIGVSKVEAALETADAKDLQAQAEMNRHSADLGARRTEVEAQINQRRAEADAFRQKYNREYSKALAQIKAREAELSALIERKDVIVSAIQKEGSSQESMIVANGREKFDSETARIAQIRGIHNAIEVESNARILEMMESSKATRERAAAMVAELETQADSTRQEMLATVAELEEQIKSTEVQTRSEAERLRVSREALLQDTGARVKDIRSKADTVRANLASEEYQLKLTAAESEKLGARALTQERVANAPTRLEKAMAEIDSLRGDIRHHQDRSEASYGAGIAENQARLDDELNEVRKIRVASDRAENVARAEFVKAEAGARAEAVRQTAVHAEEVAEAMKRQIIAEAEAEAARIKQEVLEEIAAKKRIGKVEFANNTTPEMPLPDSVHEVPAVPQVVPVAPRIEPDHVAQYRTSFAEVMRARAQADSIEMVANATFAEAKTNLLAVKMQQDAIANEKLAVADALEAQARSRFKEIETVLKNEMDVVESQYRQSVVMAESFRKEKEAEAMDLYSQADALEQIANARAEQLFAEAEAVTRSGQNRVKELKVALWAIQQRGEAQYAKLMTEAKSVSDSQEALALQIDAQVAAAQKNLKAELSKIASSITSAERIAQADYQQAMTQAEVLRQKVDAEVGRTNAQFAMEHSILRTQIERDKQLALSQVMRSEAAYDRIIADVNTNRLRENANLDALYATAEADLNIILASNAAKREAAQTHLDAVKARFSARVEQVKAERVIDMATEHSQMALRRTDLSSALAQAMAAREESNLKLTELQKQQANLQTASLVNWSEKLAKVKQDPMEFKTLELDSAQQAQTSSTPKVLTSVIEK